jgi:hypothetical protein
VSRLQVGGLWHENLREAAVQQIRVARPRPTRPRKPPPLDTRTPSGRVLPY